MALLKEIPDLKIYRLIKEKRLFAKIDLLINNPSNFKNKNCDPLDSSRKSNFQKFFFSISFETPTKFFHLIFFLQKFAKLF